MVENKSFALAPAPQQKPHYECDGFSDPRALRALVALMDMEAVLGGAASHWGGPAALAELVSATYGLVFSEKGDWRDNFHVINDIGHCENIFYAAKANYGFSGLSFEKLRGFRSLGSPLTGHGEVHLFPEGVYLSNGPLGSTVAQAQGLCFSDKVCKKDRLCILFASDGGLMEGEAREALAAIAGLAKKNKMAPFVLILSDNNKKLSGSLEDDAFSMSSSFDSLETLGWDVIFLKEAHDLLSCVDALKEAFQRARKNPKKPVVVRAKTIKGYGVEKTAQSSSGGHGFPLKKPEELYDFLKEIYKEASVPKEFLLWVESLKDKEKTKTFQSPKDYEKVQVGVGKALIKKAQEGSPLFSISSDLYGSTGLGAFRKEFPHLCQDVGVAESNMISMAAGLSKQGFIPVVDTFAQFGTTKGALPLLMAALSQAPMIAFFSHMGFQDAADGASHQSLNYFSLTSSLAHTEVYSLSCSQEAYELVCQAIDKFQECRKKGKTPPHFIFFLGREVFPKSYHCVKDYTLGKAAVVYDNQNPKVVLASSGSLVTEVIQACEKLQAQGVPSVAVHCSPVNYPDRELFSKLLEKTPYLVTIEDHQIKGGMGSYLISELKQQGLSFRCCGLGVKGGFGQSAYTAYELYKKHGLDSDSIVESALTLLKN